MSDELLRWRSEFPILARCTYLISNSLGAMPKAARAALDDYATAWATRGVLAWESASGDGGDGWWTMPETVGSLVAPLIGAWPREVVMLPNVTSATAAVLSCFDFPARRNRIVVPALEFPSVRYVCQAQCRRGAEVMVVPSEDGIRVPTERVLEAIDERTALVVLSHVVFLSAHIQNVAAITRRAHAAGARVQLDVFHSAGILPFSVRDMGVDFAAGGVLKWLCGGPGGGFLYVREDLRSRLTPAAAGWLAHRRPFAFEPEMDLRDDAWRFLSGTPAIPSLYAARPGLEIIAEAGVENIRRKSMRQTCRLVERALESGWRVNSPLDAEERGGTVTIDVPDGERVCRELIARNIVVDYRPRAGIRIAPHFYTSDAEVDALLEEMRSLSNRG